MSAGLIGSFETKFNEILWLSQSNFLWEEVRKGVGHASSLLNQICRCLCLSTCLCVCISTCLCDCLSTCLCLCTFACLTFLWRAMGYTCKLPFNSSTNLCFQDSKFKCGIKQQISQHFTSNLIGCQLKALDRLKRISYKELNFMFGLKKNGVWALSIGLGGRKGVDIIILGSEVICNVNMLLYQFPLYKCK